MPSNGAFPAVDPLNWETVQPMVDQLVNSDLTPDRVDEWLLQWSRLEAVLQEAGAQIYRDVTENIADSAAEERFNHFVEVIMPASQIAADALKRKLLAQQDYNPPVDSALLVKRFETEAEIFRQDNVPLESELALLGNQYNKIVGGMTVRWQGEEITLPEARKLLEEPDRATREGVWRGWMEVFLAQQEALNALYLKMLPLRRQLARNADLPDYRAYRWKQLARFDYTPEDCFVFHDAIEAEVVPLASRLYAELRDSLGINTLRPWDAEADPHGEPLRPFSDVADLEMGGQRIFDRVDPVLGSYYAGMRDGFLDLGSRPNKAPGGYCNGFPVTGKPYIFMNAVGTNDNLRTLLHEGGHAFHFMEWLRQPLIWNQDAPMEFCEVASMSMELLSAPYWGRGDGGFYTPADAHRAFADQLRRIVLFLPYMAVVDSFQHWVYVDAPELVSAADLDRRWSELTARYMPGIDTTGLEVETATGWHRKEHLFSVPFYYIEYGLAQLGALQVWRNALADQSKAVANYRSALALGYTRSLPQLFSAAGARFAFDRPMLRDLMALIQEHLAVLESA